MRYLDIHSHSFAGDDTQPADILRVHSLFPSQAVQIKGNQKQPLFSIGIHPKFIDATNIEKDFETIETFATNESVVAIGECGLDRFSSCPLPEQEKIFIRQVEISEKVYKPLIIHCVRCYPEIISLKKRLNPKQKWIIHGFNKNFMTAKSLLEHGLLISFGAKLLESCELRNILSNLPSGTYFLETDEAPPTSIKDIYAAAAEARKTNLQTISTEIQKTTLECKLKIKQ